MENASKLTGYDLIGTEETAESYSLIREHDVILRLTRVPNPHVEADGGLCFRSEYGGEAWELQVSRRGLLSQRRYRVMRSGRTVARLSGLWVFPSVLDFGDGVRMPCARGLSGVVTVRDAQGRLVATASRRRSGGKTGAATIRVEPMTEGVRVMAVLVLLLCVSMRRRDRVCAAF